MNQIDSYDFSEDEKDDIEEFLADIINDPLESATKKLKGFQHTYCAYHVQTIFVNIDGILRAKDDHYRLVFKVYPIRKLVIVTKFGDRATVCDDINEQYVWDDE